MKTYLYFVFFLLLLSSINLNSQLWEELKSLENPTNLPQMAAANGKLYIVSGTSGPSAKTFEYDPETNNWSEKAACPQGCYYPTAVTVNDKIYVMGGGQPAYSQRRNYNFIYDPVTNSWTEGAPLIDPRLYHSAAVSNNKIYLLGGQNGDGTTEWFFDEYDTEQNIWTRKAQLLNKDAWYSGAVGIGDYIYRIGGGRWNVPTDHFEQFNTQTNQWAVLGKSPMAVHAPAAVNYRDHIIIMGGYNSGKKTDFINIYYPSTQEWALEFDGLPEPMAYHKAAVSGNYVYVYMKDTLGIGRLWRKEFTTVSVEEQNINNNHVSVYPNPFSNSTSIKYYLDKPEQVTLKVFDAYGNELKTLVKDLRTPGRHEAVFNAKGFPSGMYYYKLRTENNVVSGKLLFIK